MPEKRANYDEPGPSKRIAISNEEIIQNDSILSSQPRFLEKSTPMPEPVRHLNFEKSTSSASSKNSSQDKTKTSSKIIIKPVI